MRKGLMPLSKTKSIETHSLISKLRNLRELVSNFKKKLKKISSLETTSILCMLKAFICIDFLDP